MTNQNFIRFNLKMSKVVRKYRISQRSWPLRRRPWQARYVLVGKTLLKIMVSYKIQDVESNVRVTYVVMITGSQASWTVQPQTAFPRIRSNLKIELLKTIFWTYFQMLLASKYPWTTHADCFSTAPSYFTIISRSNVCYLLRQLSAAVSRAAEFVSMSVCAHWYRSFGLSQLPVTDFSLEICNP